MQYYINLKFINYNTSLRERYIRCHDAQRMGSLLPPRYLLGTKMKSIDFFFIIYLFIFYQLDMKSYPPSVDGAYSLTEGREARGKLRRPLVVAWHGQNYKILCAMWDRSTTSSSHIAGSNLPTLTILMPHLVARLH